MKTVNKTLRVRTGVKSGGLWPNHNQSLRVRTGVRAGGLWPNHNQKRSAR